LGVVYDPAVCPYYRAIYPMQALERRGHEVEWCTWPDDVDGRRLARCDVVHVYRIHGRDARRVFEPLVRGGTPITYDNDDDIAALTEVEFGGRRKAGVTGHSIHLSTVKMARLASTFTTTTDVIAEKYRRAGIDRVEVIGNYLAPEVSRPRNRHRGVVIGWIAGPQHQPDVTQLGIPDAVQRVLDKHSNARVECIGVDLGLADRYRHDEWLPFEDLPGRIGGFDIGLAPLLDVPLNRARSDIKAKEYAASAVPWLASPVGAFVGLGDAQGGQLVPDDGWFDALDRLVSSRRERRRLGRNGERWAKTQMVDAVAERWELVLAEAAG
jgi:glycosyltransferase involved in cell wall biosynthesis